MYARTVNGKALTFGVSGKLVRNSLIMFDHETHSLWSHLTGSAIQGPLQGARLTAMTATETTWGAWKHAYPETKVLPHDFPGQADQYEGYFANGDAGILGRKRDDARLPAKTLVVGVRIADRPKAYALDAVVHATVVDDTFAGVHLVLFANGGHSAAVFLRDIGDRSLTFTASSGRIVDRETGSVWDPLTGRALEGPLAGMTLAGVPATTSFWFGWFDFFPGTALFDGKPD